MMTRSPTIDRASYTVVPRGSLRRVLSLGRLLRKYTPAEPSHDVEVMSERLDQSIAAAEEAIRSRHREYGPTVAAAESALDTFVDALEQTQRRCLEHWQVFALPGVEPLSQLETPDGFDYAHAREQAQVAKRVYELLYAAELDYTSLSYEEQAQHMRTLEQLVAEEQLEATLDKLVGPPFTHALRDARRHYQHMVEQRTARTKGSSVNLREVGIELNRAIQNYLIALLATIRDEDPANVARIRLALRPVDALREQNLAGRNRGSSSEDGSSDVVAGEAIDELIAEQEAVDAELGLENEVEDEDARAGEGSGQPASV